MDHYAIIELDRRIGVTLVRAVGRDDTPMTLHEALTFRDAHTDPERLHVMPWDCALVRAAFANQVNDKPFAPAWLYV
jgi:hypothetical protein